MAGARRAGSGRPCSNRGCRTIVAGNATLEDIAATEALANTVARMSRCGLGQTAPNPILSTMRSFPHLYEARLRPPASGSRFDVTDALQDAIAVRERQPAHVDH